MEKITYKELSNFYLPSLFRAQKMWR